MNPSNFPNSIFLFFFFNFQPLTALSGVEEFLLISYMYTDKTGEPPQTCVSRMQVSFPKTTQGRTRTRIKKRINIQSINTVE